MELIIGLKDYITCFDKHPDFWAQFNGLPEDAHCGLEKDANILVCKISLLMSRFGKYRKIVSGWRPESFNKATPGSAPKSKHIYCQAADLEDVEGSLAKWCLSNIEALKEIGLYMESPDYTKTGSTLRPGLPAINEGWVHLQIVPPKSGNIVFIPF